MDYKVEEWSHLVWLQVPCLAEPNPCGLEDSKSQFDLFIRGNVHIAYVSQKEKRGKNQSFSYFSTGFCLEVSLAITIFTGIQNKFFPPQQTWEKKDSS